MEFDLPTCYFKIYAFISAFYSTLSFWVTLEMWKFFFKNRKTLKRMIHPGLFRQFLIMQTMNVLHVTIDFFVVRIPNTSVFTDYCSSENPQTQLETLVFLNYSILYSKHFTTVFFCFLRVVLLFSNQFWITTISNAVFFTSLASVLLGFSLAFPRILSPVICAQLGFPYPVGSIIILSEMRNDETPLHEVLDVIITPSVVIILIVLNIFMFTKLYQKRKLHSILRKKDTKKAEKVLSITIILILLPAIVNFAISVFIIFDMFAPPLFLIRPYFIDARAHIVNFYFFLTHPLFKKKRIAQLVPAKRVTFASH